MSEQTAPIAVLFADVCGSTQLYERHGDLHAHQIIADCMKVLARLTEAESGTVVKTIGDEILCTFDSADAALAAASAMQDRPLGEQLSIRAGLHFGPVLHAAGDVFGDTVNVAARVVALASAGELLMSGELVGALSPLARGRTRWMDRLPVKGKREPIEVHRFVQTEENLTVLPGAVRAPEHRSDELVLVYKGAEVRVDATQGFVIGRLEDCNLIVPDIHVSRRHAGIELRAGRFYLTDFSTNGTYVTVGGDTVLLKRESLQLQGSGRIALGREPDPGWPGQLEFRCRR
jgi:class 3 adenylate cyclase